MTEIADSSTFSPTDEELGLVAQIYEQAGCSRPGYIEGEAVVEIFTNSVNLSPIVLSAIWDLADEAKSGYLSETGVAIAVRLIGWAQRGEEVTTDLVNRSGPLAQIDLGPTVDIDWPTFTEDERDTSQKLFEECGPVYGLLEGDKARDAFLMFDLTPKDIWKIWEIADTRKRGALDRYDFALAMYLIQGVQSGRLSSLPPTTPPQVYEQIRAVSVSPIIPPPTSPQLSDKPDRPRKPTRAPPLPSILPEIPTLVRSPTTATSPQKPMPPPPIVLPSTSPLRRSPTSATSAQTWDVSATAKAIADQEFDVLDSSNVGYIEGDVVAKFMLRFELIPEDLALIWDLADLNNDQRLTREEFAIAMHLIEQRLNGAELPCILPTSMIPPSLRVLSAKPALRRSVTSPAQSKKSPVETRFRNSIVNGPPPLPPKPASPPLNNRHSVAISDEDRAIPPKLTSRHSIAIPTQYGHSTRRDQPVIDIFPEQVKPEPEPQTIAVEHYQTLEQENRRLSSKIEELSLQISAQSSPFDEAAHVSMEHYQALEEENFRLSSNIKDLTSQVSAQSGMREQNDTLSRKNTQLLAKIFEMEQITSDVLESNEAAHQSETQNAELKRRLADLERLQPQLEDTSRRLENALQDNRDLSTRLREAREAVETESHRAAMAMEDMRKNMQVFELDNENLRYRAHELQKSISEAGPSTSTSAQEMVILMSDLTRENENLKQRLRQMEHSTENLLLSTSGHAEHENLRRVNQRLTTQVQDLEQLIRELQRSSEEHEMQRVLRDVTMENGQLKGSLRDMRLEVTQLQQTARQVEPLQTEIEQLKAEVRRLHAENARVQTREESSVPPPAYEDDPFH
ncbi:hypothetical protein C0991_004307 [Blastosporella zonata]|nr:hypothetical protein C0991_004307 [Blastosporella zonata]